MLTSTINTHPGLRNYLKTKLCVVITRTCSYLQWMSLRALSSQILVKITTCLLSFTLFAFIIVVLDKTRQEQEQFLLSLLTLLSIAQICICLRHESKVMKECFPTSLTRLSVINLISSGEINIKIMVAKITFLGDL